MDIVFLMAHYLVFFFSPQRTKCFFSNTMAYPALINVINQPVFAQDFEDREGW